LKEIKTDKVDHKGLLLAKTTNMHLVTWDYICTRRELTDSILERRDDTGEI
jgi:hypothetical protein